jgi:hypothetical protein
MWRRRRRLQWRTLYFTTGAVVTLTKTKVALNFASFSDDNIYGVVTHL